MDWINPKVLTRFSDILKENNIDMQEEVLLVLSTHAKLSQCPNIAGEVVLVDKTGDMIVTIFNFVGFHDTVLGRIYIPRRDKDFMANPFIFKEGKNG